MNIDMNRRDLLKYLAILGVIPGAAQRRIAEASESWTSHETGEITVMPPVPTEYKVFMNVSYSLGDQWLNRWAQWTVWTQGDGSLTCEARMYQHDADALRDEEQRWRLTIPESAADLMRRFLECDVNVRSFTVRAIRRIEPNASTSPRPLGMEWVHSHSNDWSITDDRSIVHARHAPYNAIIAPKTIYRLNQEPDDTRIHERYLAIVEPLTDLEMDIRRRTVWRNGAWIVEDK